MILPEGNDGTVSVASTHVEGMRDFVAVPASHTFIMWSEDAGDQVVTFLENGRFDSENGQEK